MGDPVTLAGFRTAIQTRGGYENSADVTTTVLDDAINEAIRELYDIMVSKWADYYTVISNDLPFIGDITGTGDSLAVASGIVTLTDAGASWRAEIVNSRITITGATGDNNGTFRILSRPTATTLTFANDRATAETIALAWSIDGSSGIAVPSDFYKLRKVEILIGTDRWSKLYPHDLDAGHAYVAPASGHGYRYRLQAGNIVLSPDPGSTTETVRIFYVPRCPTLTESTDSFDAINGYGELVVQLALRMIKGDREDLDVGAIEKQIERQMRRVREMSDGRDAEPFYLDPRGPNRDADLLDDDDGWY